MNQEQQLTELIEELIAQPNGMQRVSLYLSTDPKPERMEENRIRLKNQLKKMSQLLEALDMSNREAKALGDRITAAASEWRNGTQLSNGLALFASSDYVSQQPLPHTVPELVYAGDRHHLKPLFAALGSDHRFYVLALSQNHAELYQGDAERLQRVPTDETWPGSLEQVTGSDPAGKSLHYHSGSRGGGTPIYHGRGAGKDDVDTEVQRYLGAVEAALIELPLMEHAPVVLAGVAELLAMFRNLSQFPRLAERQIEGNVEHLSENELHQRAWPLLQDRIESDQSAALNALRHSNPEEPVARQLPDVLRAAINGRVETLFVAGELECWGRVSASGREILRNENWQPGDEDLLDRAAVESYRQGGRVHVIASDKLSGREVALARLRY